MAAQPRGHASGAAMTWGARSLDRTATMVLSLQLWTWSSAATYPLASISARVANKTAVMVGKERQDGDPISEILIEHVDEDDAVVLPLLVALLVLGALIFLSLLLLGCLLVLRLCESSSTKYQRLQSEDSENPRHRSKTRRSKQSQVFTYVDLSNADCSCQGSGPEGQKQAPAPRFGVQFQAATKVGMSGATQPRERPGAPCPAPRKSRVAGMGLPSGEDDADTQPEGRPKESDTNAPESTSAPASRTAEQPTKGVSVQSPVGIPRSHGSSLNEGDEFDTYRERCTQFKSVLPQLEINVRDRFVKRHASSGAGRRESLDRTRVDRELESAVAAHTTETTYAFQPDLHTSPQTEVGSREGYDVSSDIHLSPTFSPGALSVSSPYLQNTLRGARSGYSSSEHTSPFGVEATDVPGRGRHYEEHGGRQKGRTATPDVRARQYSEVNSGLKRHEPVTVTSPSKLRHPVSSLVELPETSITARNGSTSVTSSDSASYQKLSEGEAAKARQAIVPAPRPSDESRQPVTPVRINTNEMLQRIPSTHPSATHYPYQSPSKEMSPHVPQTVAYYDRPQSAKLFMTTAGEKPRGDIVDKSSSSEDLTSTQLFAEASPFGSPTARMVSANGRLKLPQPPMQRFGKDLQARLSDDQSAVVSGSLTSVRKRRDDQSSTEPFSIGELSRQRVSASDTFSELDVPPGNVYMKTIAAAPPFVHPRSKPSFVSPLLPAAGSVSAVADERPAPTPSSEEYAKEGRDLSLLVEGAHGVKVRADSAPLMTEEGAQPPRAVVALEGPAVTSTALVRPVDTLESRARATSGAGFHLEEIPPSAAKEADLVQPSAQHYTLAEVTASGKDSARRGDSETTGNLLSLKAPAHDKEATEKSGTSPVELNAETDEGTLTPKEPLVFPLSSDSEDAVWPVEAYDTTKGSLSDAAPPYAPDLWTPFKMLSKEDREALTNRKQEYDKYILPAEVPQKQLVSKKESLIREKDATLPTEDTKAQTGAPEQKVIPEKRTLLFDDEVDKEPAAAGSFALPSVGEGGVPVPVPPGTQRAPVTYDVPPQMILHSPIPGPQTEKGTAITEKHEPTVPGEAKRGQLSDVAFAHDRQIFSNDNREAMERGPGSTSRLATTEEGHGALVSSEGSQEYVERYDEKRKSLSVALQPSASRQLASPSHEDKLMGWEEQKAPANLSNNREIQANVPQATPTDREVALGRATAPSYQTEAYLGPSAIPAQPKPEGSVAVVSQSSQPSDKNGKEPNELEDKITSGLGKKFPEDAVPPTAQRPPVTSSPPPQMLLFGPQPSFWDFTNAAIISRQEYTVPGETTGGPFSDVVSAEDKQITSDEKKVPSARGRGTAIGPISDVVPEEVKQSTSEKRRVPVARDVDTDIGPFKDVDSAENKHVTTDEKRGPMEQGRDTDAAPSNGVVSVEDKQMKSDENKVPIAQGHGTAIGPIKDVATTAAKQITSGEKRKPMTRDRDTPSAPANAIVSAEDKQVTSNEERVPGARGRGTAIEPLNDVAFSEDKQTTTDEETVPAARARHTAVGSVNGIVSVEDELITRDENRHSVERGSTTTGVVTSTKPHYEETKSLSKAAPPFSPDQLTPFPKKDDMALSREGNLVPADHAEGPDRIIMERKVSGKKVTSETQTNSQVTAAEEKVIPVIIPVKRSPPGSYLDDEDFRAADNASGPSVTESVASSQQPPSVISTPPPQMPLHGLLPPILDDKHSALITRQEYTVPGKTTGGPFSGSERRHSEDLGSPESPELRFSADRRTAAEGAGTTEQTGSVLKTAKRRSSWADSSQSQFQPPSSAHSLHSLADLSPPPYGDLTHTSSMTAFLSERVPVHEVHAETATNDTASIHQQPGSLNTVGSPGGAMLPSYEPPLPHSVDVNTPLLPKPEDYARVTVPAQLPTLTTSDSIEQRPPAEATLLQASEKRNDVSLGKQGRDVNDKLKPPSGSEMTADLLRSDSPRSKSMPPPSKEESPSDVPQNNGSITSAASPGDSAVDRQGSEPPGGGVTADQRDLVTSPAEHTSVDSHHQGSSVPAEREGKIWSTVERLNGQLKSVPDRALMQPVTRPDQRELEPLPVYEPTIASRLPPHWTSIERRKQELLANAKLNGQPKTPADRALGQPAAEPPTDAKPDQRGLTTTTARQAEADSDRHPKWFPMERPNRELSDRKRNAQLRSPPSRAIAQAVQEQPVDVSIPQRELETAQASELDSDSRNQPQGSPLESTSQFLPFNARHNGQERWPHPVSEQPLDARLDKGELEDTSQPASVDINGSKSSAVRSAASPATPETTSRNGREVIPAYDNSAATRMIKPSDKSEHGVFVTPVEELPVPSDAHGSRTLAASPDVFFRKTSPVPAHGSSDLITFKPEEASDAQAAGSSEGKRTRRLEESATVDQKDKKDPTEEPKM